MRGIWQRPRMEQISLTTRLWAGRERAGRLTLTMMKIMAAERMHAGQEGNGGGESPEMPAVQ